MAGAGVLGLALGLELARRGVETVVLDRGAPGPAAGALSAAGTGLVDPQSRPGPAPESVRDLSLLSRHLFGDWIEALEEETGLPCEYDVRGGLAVALADSEEVILDRALDWQRARALAFDVLPGEEVRSREPALSEAVRAAFSFPEDGQIHPSRLARALLLAARRAGTLVVGQTPVTGVRVGNGFVSGVETPAGSVRAEAVVDAAGAGAGLLGGAPPLPLTPVRIPQLLLDAADDPDRLTRFVHGTGCALAPRRDGTLLVAGESGRGGFDPDLSAREAAGLLSSAARIVPAAGGYPLLAARAFFAGASPDGGPIAGETATAGLFVAAGEGRDAVLLAPALALLLADLLTGQTPPLSPAPFSPARFGL